MKNKRKAKTFSIVAVCIVIAALSVLIAFKYKGRLFPAQTSVSSENETVSDTKTTAQVTEKTASPKKDKTESDNSSERTILNCPDLKGNYEPTAFEAKLFNAINEKRAEKNLLPLNWNDCLHTRAKVRADEILVSFSHTRPDGRKPSTVLSDEKINFSLFGECLAKGTNEDDAGVTLLINGLMKDESQNTAIFSKDYIYAAVSVSLDESGSVHAVILLCNP